MSASTVIALAVAGYLMGSIPFGLLLARMSGLGDVRAIGSGNIGATNVLRTGSKVVAALTLLCDMAKGLLPAWIGAHYFGATGGMIAGAAAFAGHVFPVWLRFQGGKGVATYIGAIAGLAWPLAAVFCAVWLMVAAGLRYSSASSLASSALAPAWAWFFYGDGRLALWMAVLGLVIFSTHRENIKRLMAGEESKIRLTR